MSYALSLAYMAAQGQSKRLEIAADKHFDFGKPYQWVFEARTAVVKGIHHRFAGGQRESLLLSTHYAQNGNGGPGPRAMNQAFQEPNPGPFFPPPHQPAARKKSSSVAQLDQLMIDMLIDACGTHRLIILMGHTYQDSPDISRRPRSRDCVHDRYFMEKYENLLKKSRGVGVPLVKNITRGKRKPRNQKLQAVEMCLRPRPSRRTSQ